MSLSWNFDVTNEFNLGLDFDQALFGFGVDFGFGFETVATVSKEVEGEMSRETASTVSFTLADSEVFNMFDVMVKVRNGASTPVADEGC